jgi:hypothetical protein
MAHIGQEGLILPFVKIWASLFPFGETSVLKEDKLIFVI